MITKERIKFNKTTNKNEIKDLIKWFINNYGGLRTQKLLDKLKELGFKIATKTGISITIEDLKVPKSKKNFINNAEKEIENLNQKISAGEINLVKYTEKTNQIWSNTNELLKNEIIDNFRQNDLINPIYIMTLSGARGNIAQIKQLVGMRGLMSDSQGEIISTPIKSNLKEGLTVFEYFISCYGARKGIVDTALKTANSGYLTRRLVYAAQNQLIKKNDCYTNSSTLVLALITNKQKYKMNIEKTIGRILAKDLINEDGKKIASAGQDICNVRLTNLIKQ
jgi:DNA-directed RNA polymerase subunit beta'